ncbi:MAG: patatin-like phospholipase family protein [Methylobacter sp.]|nr:MAG: patatin-like phospholipase family protein [Methylobacter sp.]
MSEKTTQERLGLGLSGGGLRASFFHIGVLAQMAELNLLRHVEVISTVSGGSIIGALYYLHVKALLESKADADITDQDYVNIVSNIEQDFLAATEKNIRMATFSSFVANFKMRFLNYSRSDRIGELYNEWLYQSVLQNAGDPVEMRNLKIYPGGQMDFHPNQHNADRSAKVPILVLNATALNTGRDWQFTAQTMGEPFISKDDPIDTKPIRLLQANAYGDIVPSQQNFPLGHAVAASACVPGLFDPMSVSGLYSDLAQQQEIRAQLVDGGVHDNQGIEGLINNGCSCFVISDASGQMDTQNSPGTGAISVLLRVSSVLQDRVRTEGLQHLMDSRGTHNVAFMNLRKGIEIKEIHWVDQDSVQAPDTIIAPTSTNFGVHPDVQDSLSKMRTDLDAFTEVEAYSLMLDGYLMSRDDLQHFKDHAHCMRAANPAGNRTLPETPWKFQAIAPWINNPTDDYRRQLEIAQSTFGKALMRFVWLKVALLVVIAVAVYFLWPQIKTLLLSSVPVYVFVGAVLIWLINDMAPKLAHKFRFLELLRPYAEISKATARAAGLLLATVFIKFYLYFINPLYVEQGRVSKLTKP